MAKDYYATLGISKDADEDAIKQAYKKMALKWHPDRNLDKKEEAERRFKEIGEAFEVLSDKQKRAVYDQYGEAGLKGGVPMDASGGAPNGFSSFPGGFTFSSTNADDIFRQFFSSQGINDPFSSGPRSSRSSRASMGGMGGMPGMGGMGGMPGGFSFMDVDSDGQFGGQPQADHLTVKKRLACTLEELYTGVTKKMKVTRRRADGTSEEKVLTVSVKPGWKSGTKITFNGEGDEIAPSTFQNIVFTLEEKPHSTFKRDGNNLITTLEISLGEALAGFSKTITTLDNRQIPISSESIIEPNTTKRIPNEGMPISKSPGQKGDLIVQFKIRFPRSLTTAQKQQIRSALL